jgi:hypothetical protein
MGRIDDNIIFYFTVSTRQAMKFTLWFLLCTVVFIASDALAQPSTHASKGTALGEQVAISND